MDGDSSFSVYDEFMTKFNFFLNMQLAENEKLLKNICQLENSKYRENSQAGSASSH